MKRLFITLYLVILATMLGFGVAQNLFLDIALSSSMNSVVHDTYRGTIYLLDQEIADSADIDATVHEINQKFGYEVSLVPASDLPLNMRQQQQLSKEGSTYFEHKETDYAVAESTVIDDRVWRLQLDQTEQQDIHQSVKGTVQLFIDRFSGIPESKWNSVISDLEPHFSVSISLLDRSDHEIKTIDSKNLARLDRNLTIGFDESGQDQRYYFLIPNSNKVIKISDFPYTALFDYLVPIIILVLAALFGLTIYLWMVPLWQSLRSLEVASHEFGQGRFSSRAAISGLSPIKQISHSFNAMAARVESLISSHKELTNAVSHELRTPLARMRFGIEMLSDSGDKHKRGEYLQDLSKDVDELDALIAELLTYARFERAQPKLSFTEQYIVSWLEQQIERTQRQTNTISIRLHYSGISKNKTLNFESRLLARALSNIMQNALRYAKAEIDVILKLSSNAFTLMVDDDGEGISQDKRENIFDPFSRVDQSRSRDTGGFGVGLAIVKQVAEWHSGSVSVDDSPLGGARFTIQIPQTK